MYYYFRSEPGLWTVAHGEHPNINTDSDWGDREDAARRVHYLNGGDDEKLHTEIARLRALAEKYEARTVDEAYMEMEALYLLTRDERDNDRKNLAATQAILDKIDLQGIAMALNASKDDLPISEHILPRIIALKDRLNSANEIIEAIDFQKIGELLGLRIGESVAPAILPALKKMSEDISALRKYSNQAAEDKKSLAEVIFVWQNEPERTAKWYADYIAIRDGYGQEHQLHGHGRYVELLAKIKAAGIPLAQRDLHQLP